MWPASPTVNRDLPGEILANRLLDACDAREAAFPNNFVKTLNFPLEKSPILARITSHFVNGPVFPSEKIMQTARITEKDVLAQLRVGAVLLPPLVVVQTFGYARGASNDQIDARVELALPGMSDSFKFVVEAKSQSTPLVVQSAIAQTKAVVQPGEFPMIMVPYLSAERLEELEREQVSGVDMSGNGVVIVPNRLYVRKSGQPNRYPESRPLDDPYSGRSALVARFLLSRSTCGSLKELVSGIRKSGGEISMSQASKAVQALSDELMVFKVGRVFCVRSEERGLLLEKLNNAWQMSRIRRKFRERLSNGQYGSLPRQFLRLTPNAGWARALSADWDLRWAVTGESSVTRYIPFAQAGPRRIAVSSIARAVTRLDAKPEPVPNFADLELIETDEPGFYFQNEVDKENGARWASRVQCWLELQAGDGRQREAADELLSQIINGIET